MCFLRNFSSSMFQILNWNRLKLCVKTLIQLSVYTLSIVIDALKKNSFIIEKPFCIAFFTIKISIKKIN